MLKITVVILIPAQITVVLHHIHWSLRMLYCGTKGCKCIDLHTLCVEQTETKLPHTNTKVTSAKCSGYICATLLLLKM